MDRKERNITYAILKGVFTFLSGLFGWLKDSNDKDDYSNPVLQ